MRTYAHTYTYITYIRAHTRGGNRFSVVAAFHLEVLPRVGSSQTGSPGRTELFPPPPVFYPRSLGMRKGTRWSALLSGRVVAGVKVLHVHVRVTHARARSMSVDSKDIVQSLNSPASRSVMPHSASGGRHVTCLRNRPRPPAAPPNFAPLTHSTYIKGNSRDSLGGTRESAGDLSFRGPLVRREGGGAMERERGKMHSFCIDALAFPLRHVILILRHECCNWSCNT